MKCKWTAYLLPGRVSCPDQWEEMKWNDWFLMRSTFHAWNASGEYTESAEKIFS